MWLDDGHFLNSLPTSNSFFMNAFSFVQFVYTHVEIEEDAGVLKRTKGWNINLH